MSKIGIVGKAVEYWFKSVHEISIYDKFKDSESLDDVVKKSEFIFIWLPTPYKDNYMDLAIMHENIKNIIKLTDNDDKIIVIKSSVIPGTTRDYSELYFNSQFCFNPEFLTEANYLQDFVNADRIIVGSYKDRTGLRVTGLYWDRFPKTPLYMTDLTSAEMVKFMANTFLATKIIFANEMFEACENLGIKYEEVKEMVIADERIGPTHLDVTSVKGFGGICFPKDIVGMIGLYKDLGVDASLLNTVWEKNLRIRTHRDWEDIPFVKNY